MRVRRAVVTGGAGFLGSHLCHRLLQDGYEVICLDDFCTGNSINVEHLLEDRRFRLVRADVTDYVHVSGHVDAVLHLASPASPIDYLQLPLHTLKVGSIGTFHCLGLAKEKQARFLLASTSESYGDPLVRPSPRRTGATSIRSAHAASTTRPNGSRRRRRWRIATRGG